MSVKEEYKHIGSSQGMKNHDHDMIHELSERLDSLWRYDQYIENAKGKKSLENFWAKLKKQERANITSLKRLIREHVRDKCF